MRFAMLSLALVAAAARPADSYPSAKHIKAEPGKATPAIAAISDRLRQSIAAKEIAGAVTLVATPDQVLHLDATGNASIDPVEAMRTDSIFWIASMTKPVTATLVLMLQDEGMLSVDDPVEKYLPEFKALKTADGKPARVTIRHLLTHTSGMGEINGGPGPRGEDARRCHSALCRQAGCLRAGLEMGVLPVGHQYGRADRRGRLEGVA